MHIYIIVIHVHVNAHISVVYKTITTTLMLESSLNSKKCVRIFSLRSKILTHFFKFKLDSNIKVVVIVLYTTYKLKKKKNS